MRNRSWDEVIFRKISREVVVVGRKSWGDNEKAMWMDIVM
jgi:hypothetical protein